MSIDIILNDSAKFNEIARSTFENVDLDQDGYVSFEELQIIMNKISNDIGGGDADEEEVRDVMSELDTDNDGKLAFDEFKILIYQTLEAMKNE